MTEIQAAELLLNSTGILANTQTIIAQQQTIYGASFVLIGVVIACAIALIVTEVLRGL